MWAQPAFQQGLQAWDPTSRHARSCCCEAPPPLPCSSSVGWPAGPVQGSQAGGRLLSHAGSTVAGKQRSDERISHVSAKEDLQAAVGVKSSLAAAAGTPGSSCASLRNLGVCAGGLGPHSYVISKPYLFIPFTDTTMLAASDDEIIRLFFPLVDFHDG